MGYSYRPYVVEFNVPHEINDSLKPLDIIWVGMEKGFVAFCHVGVYLGEG
jgi:hypothetical protein